MQPKTTQVVYENTVFVAVEVMYRHLGVAQLVAHKTGGLGVAGSSPVTQTIAATSHVGRNKKGSTKVPPFLIASFGEFAFVVVLFVLLDAGKFFL